MISKLYIDTNSNPNKPEIRNERGILVPYPMTTTIASAENLEVFFTGDNLPSVDDELSFVCTYNGVVIARATLVCEDFSLRKYSAHIDFATGVAVGVFADKSELLTRCAFVIKSSGTIVEWQFPLNVLSSAYVNVDGGGFAELASEYAYRSSESAQDASEYAYSASESALASASSAGGASASATSAQGYANSAKTYATNAQGYSNDASSSASSATASKSLASEYAYNASSSASSATASSALASEYAYNAKEALTEVNTAKGKASEYAYNASVSANASASSATASQGFKTQASEYAYNASYNSQLAGNYAGTASEYAYGATTASASASASATNSQTYAGNALAYRNSASEYAYLSSEYAETRFTQAQKDTIDSGATSAIVNSVKELSDNNIVVKTRIFDDGCSTPFPIIGFCGTTYGRFVVDTIPNESVSILSKSDMSLSADYGTLSLSACNGSMSLSANRMSLSAYSELSLSACNGLSLSANNGLSLSANYGSMSLSADNDLSLSANCMSLSANNGLFLSSTGGKSALLITDEDACSAGTYRYGISAENNNVDLVLSNERYVRLSKQQDASNLPEYAKIYSPQPTVITSDADPLTLSGSSVNLDTATSESHIYLDGSDIEIEGGSLVMSAGGTNKPRLIVNANGVFIKDNLVCWRVATETNTQS